MHREIAHRETLRGGGARAMHREIAHRETLRDGERAGDA